MLQTPDNFQRASAIHAEAHQCAILIEHSPVACVPVTFDTHGVPSLAQIVLGIGCRRGVAFRRQLAVAGGGGQLRFHQLDGLGLLRVLRDGSLLPTLLRGEDAGGWCAAAARRLCGDIS